MSQLEVQLVDPKSLRPHALNKWLYGAPELPDDFVQSIREGGVREPLRVTRSGAIISGHRRQAGAIKAECQLVPIVIEPEALDDLALRRELIISNKQREKTVEQRTREFDELAGVEKELAKQRQKAGKPSAKKNGRSGEAKAIAAEQVGMSRSTAEKASDVVKAIDQADAAGDKAKAAELRGKLERSVASAHRTARPDAAVLKAETATDKPPSLDALGVPIPRCIEKAFQAATTFDAVLNLLRSLTSHMNKAVGDKGLELRPGFELLLPDAQEMRTTLRNFRNRWTFAKPYAVCPDCKASGKECHACDKRGWITKDCYERNFKAGKSASAVCS